MKRHASMNRVYRIVWSEALNAWVAVAEIARGRGKSSSRKLIAAALSVSSVFVHAAPIGGQVVSGAGTIAQSGAVTTINQSTQNLSLNWKSFNINSNETVNFVQPSASAIAVNRIYDTNGTTILGHLNANGQVWLLNPNGILFGQGSQVNVGGLVASTLDTMSNNGSSVSFSGSGTGSIVNNGAINGHYVALISNTVSNTGAITSNLGAVALGAGSSVTLTFAGNDLVHMQVDKGVLNALVENGGAIRADGGMVILSAGAKDELLASVVNNTGIVRAQTVEDRNGTITLLGGMISGTANVGGILDASAPNGGKGGFIETSAHNVKIANDARITTAAAQGLSGTWLIDPVDFTVASTGGDITGAALGTLLGSNSVTIQTGATGTNTATNLYANGATGTAGNINVNDAVSWSANTLTLSAYNNINIEAAMNGSGTAKLALQYGQGATNGAIGGVAAAYNVNAAVNLPAGNNFSTKLGSTGAVVNYAVITSLGIYSSSNDGTLQGMGGNLSGNYALGANIDASGTSGWNTGAGFYPVGNSVTKFTGNFEGLGHTISSLTINLPLISYVGLFGYSTGTLRDVGLLNSNISGQIVTGALAGRSDGSVSYSYASGGSVTGAQNVVGGLIGQTGGSVGYSYANVSVTGQSSGVSSTAIGGLVGSVLAGGSVSNSYAVGSVSGGTDVGGLAGQVLGGATLTNDYSGGAVTWITSGGGLIGSNFGTVASSYWDTTTSGTTSSGAGTGYTTAQMQTMSSFSGWSIANSGGSSSTWRIYEGHTYPLLTNFLAPLTVTATGATKTYDGLAYSGGKVSYSATPNSNLLGAVAYGGTSQGAKNAGSYAITLSGLYSNQQGYDISYSSGTLTVNQAPLTVTANNASKTYGQAAMFAGTAFTSSGLQNGETIGSVTETSTGSASTATVAGGPYAIVPSLATGGTFNPSNYSIVYANGSLTINPLPVTLTGSMTYNGSTGVAGSILSASNLVSGDSLTITGGGTLASKNAGSESIASFGTLALSNSNYTMTGASGSVTINPLPVTLTGSMTYNGSTGVAGSILSASNLVLGDSLTITGSGTLASKNAGSESIASFGTLALSNSNYTMTGASGSVTINPLPVTLTAPSVTKTYDGGTAYTTVSSDLTSLSQHLVGGDTVTAATIAFADRKVGTANKTVNLSSVTISDGNNGGNYTVSLAGNNSSTITQLASATWVGPATGLWSNASYWAPSGNLSATGAIPDGQNVANVIIPAGKTVTFDSTVAATTLSGLNAALTASASGSLTVSGGSLSVTGGTVLSTFAMTGGTWSQIASTLPAFSATQFNFSGGAFVRALGGNGTTASPYQLADIYGVQAMAGNLSGSYALANNIDALGTGAWNSGAGFNPIGNSTAQFQGSFDGQNHTLSGLTINQSLSGYGGLFGAIGSGGSVKNVGLTGASVMGFFTYAGGLAGGSLGSISNSYATGSVAGADGGIGGLVGASKGAISNSYATVSVTGGSRVGGLVGWEDTGTISNSYATGSVSGTDHVGGLVGYGTGAISNSHATGSVTGIGSGKYIGGLVGGSLASISNSYATGSVTGSNYVGGLVGQGKGAISNSYATGSVTGSQGSLRVGGLAGYTSGSISNSYATGSVTGSNYVGGLTGYNIGTINSSFWDTATSGQANPTGGIGMTTAQMQTQANFTGATAANGNVNPGWDFTNTWVMYDGHTYPLLRAFMTPLTVTANNASKTYDGLAYSGGNGVTYSVTPNANLLGTLSYSGSSQGAVNAGSYAITPSGLYSTLQQGGYAINFVNGSLTVNPKILTVTGETASNKVYDGGTVAMLTGGVLSGLVNGDTVTLTQAGSFASKNVGNNITVTASDIIGGASASNYVLTQPTGLSANITPATLTYNAASASIVQGQPLPGLSGTVAGFVAGDSLVSSTTGSLLWSTTASASSAPGQYPVTGSGLSAANYVFVQASGNAKALTIGAGSQIQEPVIASVENSGSQVQADGISGMLAYFSSNPVLQVPDMSNRNILSITQESMPTWPKQPAPIIIPVFSGGVNVPPTSVTGMQDQGKGNASIQQPVKAVATMQTATVVQVGVMATEQVTVTQNQPPASSPARPSLGDSEDQAGTRVSYFDPLSLPGSMNSATNAGASNLSEVQRNFTNGNGQQTTLTNVVEGSMKSVVQDSGSSGPVVHGFSSQVQLLNLNRLLVQPVQQYVPYVPFSPLMIDNLFIFSTWKSH